jgi:hypothetical protein
MKQDEIIEMARQAAAVDGHIFKEIPSPETVEFITAFYKLVAAKEREACAKVAWDYGWKRVDSDDAQRAAVEITDLIRARGEQ